MNAIAGPIANTPEWDAYRLFDPNRERPVVIGASEAAAACGRSRYCSRLELYLRKRGEFAVEWTKQQVEAMEIGHAFEPVILDLYEKRQGIPLVRGLPMFFSVDRNWMAATPDGLPTDMAIRMAVDAKSTNWRMLDESGEDTDKFGVPGTDQVPLDYLFQAQHQMVVLGLPRVDFPVLSDGRTLLIYTVERNENLIEEIVESTFTLSQAIIRGEPPEPDFTHANTRSILESRKSTEGKRIEWPESLRSTWAELENIRQKIKALKSSQDRLNNMLISAMGDAEIADCGEFEVRRIQVSGSTFTVSRQPSSHLKKREKKSA